MLRPGVVPWLREHACRCASTVILERWRRRSTNSCLVTMKRDAAPSSDARRQRRHRQRSCCQIPDCGTAAAAPSTPRQDGKRPMSRSEADKATPGYSQHNAAQLPTKSDSENEEFKLRASRRIVKRKHICSTCESGEARARRANTSKSTPANDTSNYARPKRSSIKARRKLILDA